MQRAHQEAKPGRGESLLGRGDGQGTRRVTAAGVLDNRDGGNADLAFPPVVRVPVDANLLKFTQQAVHRADGAAG